MALLGREALVKDTSAFGAADGDGARYFGEEM